MIVVLITLSVIGILFIQMSWIENEIKLKQDELQTGMENALNKTRDLLQSRFIYKTNQGFVSEESKEFFLNQNFTLNGYFTTDAIRDIIEQSLREYNVKYNFEFCVTNVYNYSIFQSEGFKVTDLHKAQSILLSPKESLYSRETLYVFLHEDRNQIIWEMWEMIAASIIFTCIIILAFAVTVRTLFNQKKLSEIKSDFINNMTHELKTPLATISLAIDALTNEKVIHNAEKVKLYSNMIKEENKRMNKQVEKILQAARLEKEEIKLNLQAIDTHEAINKVADNIVLQIQEKNGILQLRLNAHNHIIEADEVHFSNIIFNLLDNAMKYSDKPPYIEVETLNTHTGALAIKVTDNGIGMDKETQSRIFERFFRAHTGNLHNVKGFGLGLSYVKAIVEAHDGKIKVESTPGKGSTFTVTLPVKESK